MGKILIQTRIFIISLSVVSAFILLMMLGCNNIDKQEQQTENTVEDIRFDCRVWGDEANGYATVKIELVPLLESGPSVELPASSTLLLDNQPLQSDSSTIGGWYYEAVSQAADFAGKHQVNYVSAQKDSFQIDFDFPYFKIADDFPQEIKKTDTLNIGITGLADETAVYIILLDTSFAGSGVEKMDTVRNGKIAIRPAALSRLKSGPIRMDIYKNSEKKLTNTTMGDGRLSVSYTAGKSFNLHN